MSQSSRGRGDQPGGHRHSALGKELRLLFKAKRSEELGQRLPLPFVWLIDEPLSIDDALALAEKHLANAKDLEITMLRIVNSESSATSRTEATRVR